MKSQRTNHSTNFNPHQQFKFSLWMTLKTSLDVFTLFRRQSPQVIKVRFETVRPTSATEH
jgi:hypothetical protein